MRKQLFGHKSYNSARSGVSLFIQGNYKHLIGDYKNSNQMHSNINKLQIRFLRENKLEYINKLDDKSADYNANIIQDNWDNVLHVYVRRA